MSKKCWKTIKKLFSRHRHKWDYVYDVYKRSFLGEEVENKYVHFRICKDCGKAQEFVGCSVGSFWCTLTDAEAEVLKRKMVRRGGKWYVEYGRETKGVKHEEG